MTGPLFPMIVEGESPRQHAARRLTRRLKRAGATGPSEAIALESLSRLEERALHYLIERGVVRPGKKGGYWLDESRQRELRHALWRLVAMILIVELGVIAALLLNLPRHGR